MSCNYDSPEAMTEGLEFLNKSFRLLYFRDIPKLVFGLPQRLLNLMTEITVHHIKLTTNPDQAETYDGIWNDFKEKAIVSEKILKSISKSYTDDFTAKQMLEVMEKLFITCKVEEGKYLMPSLLTALATLQQSQSTWLKWLPFGLGSYLQKLISGMKSDITVLAHFPDGLSRFGVFCGTVCKLITDYKWELYGQISRNRFQFTQPDNVGIISLIDSFDSFFIVNLDNIPPNFSFENLASLCSTVRGTVFNAINKVIVSLGYIARNPEIAFLCDHDRSNPHVAKYLSKTGYLRCIRQKRHIKEITPRNRLWLQNNCIGDKWDFPVSEATHTPIISSYVRDSDTAHKKILSNSQLSMDKLSLLKWTNKEGKVCQLNLIREICPDWTRASDLLGLTPNHTRGIEKDYQFVEDRCRAVMSEWLSNEDDMYQYPRSWEGLCQLLDNMEYSSLAEKLRYYLSNT